MLRTIGQWMSKLRRMASEFQGQFQEAMREAEMADLKKDRSTIWPTKAKSYTDFDPIGDVRKDIESIGNDRELARRRRRPRRQRLPEADGARWRRQPRRRHCQQPCA